MTGIRRMWGLLAMGMVIALVTVGCGGGAAAPAVAPAAAKLPDQIRLIVPFATGGSNDTAARVFAPALKKVLGANVLVENIAGGSGNSAMSQLAAAKPDGSMLATYFTPMLMLLPKVEKTGYDPKTITPLLNLTAGSEVLLIHKDTAYKDLKDVAKALADGKDLKVGVSGFGSNAFIAVAMLKSQKEFQKLRVVPYNSGGEVNTALIGKQVELAMVGSIAAVKPVQAGQVKALSILGSAKIADFPGVTTATEQGFKGLVVDDNLGIVGPPNMDKALIEKISSSGVKAAQDAEFVTQAKKAGLPLDVRGAADYGKLLQSLEKGVDAVVPVVNEIGQPTKK